MTAAVGFDSFFARNVIQRSRPSGWRHGVLLVRFLIHAGIHGVSNLPSKTLSTRVLQCAFQKACFDDKDEWYGAGRDDAPRIFGGRASRAFCQVTCGGEAIHARRDAWDSLGTLTSLTHDAHWIGPGFRSMMDGMAGWERSDSPARTLRSPESVLVP